MMRGCATVVLLAFFALLGSTITPGIVFAAKDSRSYGTYKNPNTFYSHYWKDASNVLEDLSQFKRLYVQYYGCAWSEQDSSTHQYRALKENDKNDKNGGNPGVQCGSAGGDNSNSWYVGMGKCMGANVAFALYGVLYDDGSISSRDHCSKKTFINSFFTTDGLTSFARAGNVDIRAQSQQCAWYYENGEKTGYTVTTGCSATGRFTTDIFSGRGCLGYNYYNTTNYLETLNDSLEKEMQCTLIYESKNDGQKVKTDYATTLLTYSEACTVEGIYKNRCPNPHKIVSTYEYNFAMAQMNSNYTVTKNFAYLDVEQAVSAIKASTSALMLLTGLALFAGGAWQMRITHKRRIKAEQRAIDNNGNEHLGAYDGVIA